MSGSLNAGEAPVNAIFTYSHPVSERIDPTKRINMNDFYDTLLNIAERDIRVVLPLAFDRNDPLLLELGNIAELPFEV